MTLTDDAIIARARRRLADPMRPVYVDGEHEACGQLALMRMLVDLEAKPDPPIAGELGPPTWNGDSGFFPTVAAGPLLALLEEAS